ncbi:MAG TPA: hypothetical protein VNS52_02145 [Gemmatimonadaceae bacterium]|nr:hypothetical protein [Gemmatimonadaceae bacterium]
MTTPRASAPGPGSRTLSEASVAALRDALRRTVGRLATSDGHGLLRDAMSVVAAEARQRQMRPEELLTAFKALLDAAPEMHDVGGRVAQARLREQLVTLCIKAYYET